MCLSPNQKQSVTKSIGYAFFARWVAVVRFPALGSSHTFSGAWQQAYVFPRLYLLCFDWFTGLPMSFVIVWVYVVLAGVITLVLVLRHSIENLSNELLLGKEKSTQQIMIKEGALSFGIS